MLQVFSVSAGELVLCSERLIGVQPAESDESPAIFCPDELAKPGLEELPIDIRSGVPAELTVTIYDGGGNPVRRLAASQITRPSPGGVTHLYWDGRDANGDPVEEGTYVIACETRVGSVRKRATASVAVGS